MLGTLSGEAFERKGTKARASVSRVFRRTVREVEVANEREERRAHTAIGGTVAHLEALIASGFRAGVIGLDPPWPFDTYNDRSPHVVRSKFETMPVDKIRRYRAARSPRTIAQSLCAQPGPACPCGRKSLEAWGPVAASASIASKPTRRIAGNRRRLQHAPTWPFLVQHQTTNLGVRSSNLFGRASNINGLGNSTV